MEHDGCVGCKYEKESEDSKYCLGCKQNAVDKYEKMTNADRIRNMSDEELADMLHNIGSYVENGEPLIDIYIGENKSTIDDSFGFILEWLQSEAEQMKGSAGDV